MAYSRDVFAPAAGTQVGGMGDLSSLSDTELDALMRDYAGEKGDLDEQMSQADVLRGSASPAGRQTGNVYTAANPLEHLASTARSGLGSYQAKQLRDKTDALRGDQRGMLAGMGKRMGSGGAPAAAPGGFTDPTSSLAALDPNFMR